MAVGVSVLLSANILLLISFLLVSSKEDTLSVFSF